MLWYLSGVATPFIVFFSMRFVSWAVDKDHGWDCEIPECDVKMGGDNDEERTNLDSWLRYQLHEHMVLRQSWHVEATEKFLRRKQISEHQKNMR